LHAQKKNQEKCTRRETDCFAASQVKKSETRPAVAGLKQSDFFNACLPLQLSVSFPKGRKKIVF